MVVLDPRARLLGFGPELDVAALEALHARGVDIQLGIGLAGAAPGVAHLTDGSSIPSETLVWTGGLRGTAAAASLGLPTDESGRIPVHASLRVVGPPAIYAIGDGARCAALDDRPDLVNSGQAAVAQAQVVARAIAAEIAGRPAPVYEPRGRGVVVLLGHRDAVARVGRWQAPRWLAPWLKQVPVLEHLWRLGGGRLALGAWRSTLLPLVAPGRVDRYTLAGDAPCPL